VNKSADAFLEEIAANYSHKWITAFKLTLDWLFRTLFEGITVDQEGLARVKEMSIKAPLILVPCHKSHLDYLILSYIFHINNMPCPHIAAGKNLSFWPMGTIFRGGGAFFMRRTFKGAELYSKIFSEYMKKILSEGFNIELFIEGTRSRTGKLLPPKFGLLSILIDAFREKACEDLLFVPVFFGYDRVLEEDAYLHEVEGGEKEPESVGQILKARRFLKKRYGKVYVNFHEPISLKSYIEEKGIDFYEQDREQHTELCKVMGYRMVQSIKKVSLATPYGIVAGAILNSPKKRFSHDQLMTDVTMYINYMKSQGIMLTETLVQNNVRSINSVIENYVRRKFIDINTDEEAEPSAKTIYKVNFSKRPLLGYYKNTCIGFFISAAYTSAAILKQKEFQFKHSDLVDTYTTLMYMFDNEFTYDRETPPEFFIRKDIKAFLNDGIITSHDTLPETYNITSEGYRRLNCFASFLRTYLESYLVVLHFFKRNPERERDSKADLKKIQSLGRRMFKNHEIELPESLSEISYKNALSYFNQKGLGESGAEDKIRYYSETIEEFVAIVRV
jgi:glycerol-3-phosphate O-acyltransferase